MCHDFFERGNEGVIGVCTCLALKNRFLKIPMEKSIIDIKLKNFPISSKSNGENDANGSWFNNRAKSIIII